MVRVFPFCARYDFVALLTRSILFARMSEIPNKTWACTALLRKSATMALRMLIGMGLPLVGRSISIRFGKTFILFPLASMVAVGLGVVVHV